MPVSPRPSRQLFIDHLRVVLTALVILHHAAIVYGGSGGWYWRQERDGSIIGLIFFNAINQSYFMGFFFLLAGYYTPRSFERKGVGPYLADRFLRLGVPLVIYFFLLSPATIALAHTGGGHPFWPSLGLMMRAREFEPGPLWFAEALLLFALTYAVVRAVRAPRAIAMNTLQFPRFTTLLLAAVTVGAVSFFLRLWIPVGKNVLWLQLGYFPGYIFLFAAGCWAASSQLLDRIRFADTKRWALVSLITLPIIPILIFTRRNEGAFSGGWNINAAVYAFWDPLLAWGIILTLLWFFRRSLSHEISGLTSLGPLAYAAYIVHPPVLVGLSLLARDWPLRPVSKFFLIGLLACAGSFALASAALRIPGARKVL